MSIKEAYNFKRVNENISTSGLIMRDQLLGLSNEGYETVINLIPNSSKYAIHGEREILEDIGIDYYYIPVDFSLPRESAFEAFCNALKESRGQKTLIHCTANYRASAFYALYAVEYEGWSREKAHEFMESIWTASDYPVWDRFIRKMERRLQLA